MNTSIALLGFIEILSAVSCGALILFLTNRIMNRYAVSSWNLKSRNEAFNIIKGSVLLSVGYVLSGVVDPILNSFRLLSETEMDNLVVFAKFLLYGGIYIATSYFLTMVIVYGGVLLYTWMTPIDEQNAITENNRGVAWLMASVVFVFVLMSKSGIMLLVESLVPYPQLPPH